MNKPESIQKFEMEMKEAAALPCELECDCEHPMKQVRCAAKRQIEYAKTMPTKLTFAEYCEAHPLPCKNITFD